MLWLYRDFNIVLPIKIKMSTVKLSKFDPSTMPDAAKVVVICTDKCVQARKEAREIVADILGAKSHIPAAFCFANDEEGKEFFSNVLPPSVCWDEFQPEVLEEIYQKQGDKSKDEEYRGNPHVLGIIEGCDKKRTRGARATREMFYNARSRKIFFLTIWYDINRMTDDYVDQIDYFVLVSTDNEEAQKKIYDKTRDYSACKSFRVFQQLMTPSFSHGCIVVHRDRRTGDMEENMFWYKTATQ